MYRCLLALLICLLVDAAKAETSPDGQRGGLSIDCPQAITVDQTPRTIPESWRAENAAGTESYYLISAAIFSGPPSQRRELRPASVRGEPNATGQTLTYEFPARYPEGIFVACRYHATSVITFKQVVPVPQRCSFAIHQTPHGLDPIRVTCL